MVGTILELCPRAWAPASPIWLPLRPYVNDRNKTSHYNTFDNTINFVTRTGSRKYKRYPTQKQTELNTKGTGNYTEEKQVMIKVKDCVLVTSKERVFLTRNAIIRNQSSLEHTPLCAVCMHINNTAAIDNREGPETTIHCNSKILVNLLLHRKFNTWLWEFCELLVASIWI